MIGRIYVSKNRCAQRKTTQTHAPVILLNKVEAPLQAKKSFKFEIYNRCKRTLALQQFVTI